MRPNEAHDDHHQQAHNDGGTGDGHGDADADADAEADEIRLIPSHGPQLLRLPLLLSVCR